MWKKLGIAIAIVASCALITSCATKNDVTMYGDYTTAVETIADNQYEMYFDTLQMLGESLKYATTPLERHLVREAIVNLNREIQQVVRASNGNDVAMKLAGQSAKLMKIAGATVVGYKGVEVLGDIVDSAGAVTAREGSTVNIEKPENHTTTFGDDNNVVSKEPVVIEPTQPEPEVAP